jgi:hypothetical protein
VKNTLKAAALIAVAAQLGCATMPVVTTVVDQPGKRVTAEASKFSFLWLSPLPAETTGQLLDDLLEQCEGADLTGVTIGTENGWVIIGEVVKVVASGYCVEPDRAEVDDRGAVHPEM